MLDAVRIHERRARVGLGCMRLSTDADRDRERALATIAAAVEVGVRVFDTARAYGIDDADRGHNERLLRDAALPADAVVITKGGMRRPRGRWLPDGRAASIRADAAASAEALGRPADVWLLHAPDPKVPLRTSLRAMAKVLEDGTAHAVGLSNVRRGELAAALDHLEIAAVEVALGAYDDTPLRDGLVELCAARGVTLLAHSPFGGPAKAPRLDEDATLRALEWRAGAENALDPSSADDAGGPHRAVLAWLLSLADVVVPIPGARRPATARMCAAPPALSEPARAALSQRFPASSFARPRVPPRPYAAGEIVLIMGIAGAGKTHAADAYTSQGYLRLNRDDRGGTLKGVAKALDDALAKGARRAVLDNTYLSRAVRADVVAIAWRHRLPVRCVFIDTKEALAQARLCARLIDRHGALPEPDALRAAKEPGVFAPTRHQRMVRELEPPSADEGFEAIEVIEHANAASEPRALVVPLEGTPHPTLPTLMIGWQPGATDEALADRRAALPPHVELAVCPHSGGAPTCWCRPPLPGLVVQWAKARGLPLESIRVDETDVTMRRLARCFVLDPNPGQRNL